MAAVALEEIRMVVTDLDGTLLKDHLQITQRNQRAIQAAVQAGLWVTVATGRSFDQARILTQELPLNAPLITFQGALIKDRESGEVIVHRAIPLNLAKQAVAASYRQGAVAYLGEYGYASEVIISLEGPLSWLETATRTTPLKPMQEEILHALDAPLTKLVLLGEEEDLDEMAAKLQHPDLFVVKTGARTLDISHTRARKGEALEVLCQHLGIGVESVMALGDSWNDMDLLQTAGWGVAMANGPVEVQRLARWVTGSCHEDGVAQAIEEGLKKRKEG